MTKRNTDDLYWTNRMYKDLHFLAKKLPLFTWICWTWDISCPSAVTAAAAIALANELESINELAAWGVVKADGPAVKKCGQVTVCPNSAKSVHLNYGDDQRGKELLEKEFRHHLCNVTIEVIVKFLQKNITLTFFYYKFFSGENPYIFLTSF